MKRTLPILLALIVASAICTLTIEKAEPTYKERASLDSPALWQGAKEVRYNLLKDPTTGEIDYQAIYDVQKTLAKMTPDRSAKNLDVEWTSAGPNNVGGRTRSVITYQEDPTRVLMGGVSGGIWRSDNSGEEWYRLESFDDNNVAVSSIARTTNGTIYVGTGNRYDTFIGNGLYYSTDDGASWSIVEDFTPSTTFNTDPWSEVNRLMADPNDDNKVWIAYGDGLATYDETNGFESVLDVNGLYCSTFDVSADGQRILAVVANQLYLSTDGGASFEDRMSNDFGDVPSGNVGRIEVAISKDDSDFMYCVVVNSGSYMRGFYGSTDGGATWYELHGDSNSGQLPFSPFSNEIQGQGIYDCALTVQPGNPQRAILGGIRVYDVELQSVNPPSSQWSLLNVNFTNDGGVNPQYVHSDIHEFHWDANGVFYIGCDGGIFKSFNNAGTFVSSNYENRTTQFYGIDFSNDGGIIGGTQDNGTHVISGFNISSNDSDQALGGDGFDCLISKFQDGLAFATIYNNDVYRTFDNGVTGINIVTPAEYPGPFWTIIDLYETITEENATEIVPFTAVDDISAGETIDYFSLSYDMPLSTVASENIAAGETVLLPDPAQSIFCVGGFGGFRMTRDATRNTVTAGDIQWATVSGLSGTVTSFEFSPDGDHMYVGTSGGRVYRISGLRDAFTASDLQSAGTSNRTQIFAGSGTIQDMAVDPNNPNRLAIARPGYSTIDHILISETAATATDDDSFVPAWNMPAGLERMPAYSVSFDVNNPDRIYAGTEYGVWVSEDLGATYEECNGAMGRVPVYALEQQTMTTEDLGPLPGVVLNEGTLYAGTFGKGIYYFGDYILNVDDVEGDDILSEVTLYPNPMNNEGQVRLDLMEASNVTMEIYDINGKQLESIQKGKLSRGEHLFRFDVSNFAEGNYVLSILTDGKRQSRAFIVTR
ncbi:MAG: T9SS type A sorting domain-containing protein [Flavobacteriales bacterium]|nr:T9SS type A sorting domain-containing protein [Flavobacteriales bacterium]